ncbi:hypothetical protein FA15DRAFT_669078 [Coprinopsis marcescibilis]|uniref:protein-tyrosine-phosphatase n=1 Tax=Coprinopsis marcescibilis TaxID=230819 RepID=A0A5C3L9H0_COPMA|nr:hypothetical protein FA15DRAFT_669078 [Coprinopsis marcescibilis]
MLTQDPPMVKTPLSGKRFRPPTLDISQAVERKPSIQLEIGPTPVKRRADQGDDSDSDSDNDVFEDTLQLSSPDSAEGDRSAITSVFKAADVIPDMGGAEFEKELADLDELRKNVKENLKLRPIRSRNNLRVDPSLGEIPVPLPSSSSKSGTFPPPPDSSSSTASWSERIPESALSSYFTPLSETPYNNNFFPESSNGVQPQIQFTAEPVPVAVPTTNGATTPRPPPAAISAKALSQRLHSNRRPLLIDARSLAAHEAFHIRSSINIAIPSLILKRCKKPGGGFQTLSSLQQYVTTEQGKAIWGDLMGQGGPWDGDVVIYDDDMNIKDQNNVGSTAWAIIPVISPLLSYGIVHYLDGGISSAGHDPDLQTLILSGEEATSPDLPPLGSGAQASSSHQPVQQKKKGGAGLFQLDTQTTYRSRQLPELELSSAASANPSSTLTLPPIPRSPLPMMPVSSSSSSSGSLSSSTNTSPDLNSQVNIIDSTPSPPPSSLAGFRRPPPPRRPSAPNLRQLDTRSMERINTNLPKLSLRTKPMRSATLGAPPSLTLQLPNSPSHLKLAHSTHSPSSPGARGPASAYPSTDYGSYMTPYFTPPHTPKPMFTFDITAPSTPSRQRSFGFASIPDPPPTARPEGSFDAPPTTEEEDAFPHFTISTILPNFLFLGPELTTPDHVKEIKALGVKRILNIAAECDDDQGLGLRDDFEKYLKIPMRDTVEEDNITRGVREVCDFLDDARLHSAPTYVHCKAGKSRSVTAVMAYLIHANRWTLSRAYSFVLERRKGISPNIGFVSELMNFEEQELGNKSVGVQPTAPNSGASADGQDGFAAAASGGHPSGSSVNSGHGMRSQRSRAHVRDSLPPALGMEGIISIDGPMSAGGLLDRVIGDAGNDMEIKDASGRYRHARRAPVNENTLQPMRRVSKAGLESLIQG